MGFLRVTMVNQAFEKSFLGQASVEDAFREADGKIKKVLGESDRSD